MSGGVGLPEKLPEGTAAKPPGNLQPGQSPDVMTPDFSPGRPIGAGAGQMPVANKPPQFDTVDSPAGNTDVDPLRQSLELHGEQATAEGDVGTSAVSPDVGEPILAPVQPRLEATGARWAAGNALQDAGDAASGTLGDYQGMGSDGGAGGGSEESAIAEDTQAVVDAMPPSSVSDESESSTTTGTGLDGTVDEGDLANRPADFLVGDLTATRRTAATGGQGLATQLFNAEVHGSESNERGEGSGGNYAANRDLINDQVGDRDFSRVPEDPPRGVGHAAPGETGALENDDADRQGSPNGHLAPDRDPGEGSHAQFPPSAWSELKEHEGLPNPGPPSDAADQLQDARESQSLLPDRRSGNAATHGWTGGGISHVIDPLEMDGAVRHTATPREWRAGRQPAFGRLAQHGDGFSFSTREQVMADLMKGRRIDWTYLAVRKASLDAVGLKRLRHREWLNMHALIRSLRDGAVLGDSTQGSGLSIDWETLKVMLDMVDSGALLA